MRSGRGGLQGSPSPGPRGILDYGGGASGREADVNPWIETGTTAVTVPFMVVPMSPGMTTRRPGKTTAGCARCGELLGDCQDSGSRRHSGYSSPAFERVLGYDSKEAIGTMNVLDYVHPEDLPHVLEETEKALSAGGSPRTRPSTASATRTARGGGWRV